MREQSYITVNQTLRAGRRDYLQHLILFLVLGFARYSKGYVIVVGNVHIRLNHRLDDSRIFHILGLCNEHFLVNDSAGRDGNNRFLLLDVLLLDDVVKLCGNHRNVGYVTIGNHSHRQLAHISVLNSDFASAVNTSNELYLPVCNIY